MLSETRLGPTAYRGYLLSLEARDNPILAFGMSVAFRNVAIAAVGDIAGTKQCQGGNAITEMTSKSWPIARTLRSAVAAAINEAIGGTNADPVSQ